MNKKMPNNENFRLGTAKEKFYTIIGLLIL